MKKVTLITLAVLLMFSMISCSGKNEKKPSNKNELISTTMPSDIQAEIEIDLSVDRLNYSNLELGLDTIVYDENNEEMLMIDEPFYESMIMDSVLIIIGKVTNIRYNSYFGSTKTVVFELRVDEILYSEKDIKVGDVVIIEHDLRYPSSLTDELVGLKLGGQYILPIEETKDDYITEWYFTPDTTWQDAIDRDLSVISKAKLESPYNTVHRLMTPVQVVHNKYYLFADEWESLMTPEATKVDVDIEMNNSSQWEERLYLGDISVLKDFKEIISKYVNEEFRQEMFHTIPFVFENNKVKMTNHLARHFEKTNLPPDKLIIINYICEKTVFGEWLLEFEVENRYLHFGKTKSSWVKYELGTEEQVISVVKGYLTKNLSEYSRYEKYILDDEDYIVISEYSRTETDDGGWIIKYTAMNDNESFTITAPGYAEMATSEQLIKNALEFMPPEYADYSASVELDRELGIFRVYFSDDKGEVKVIAMLGLFGLQRFYVICG